MNTVEKARLTACSIIEERLHLLEIGKDNLPNSKSDLQMWHDNMSKYGVNNWFLTPEDVERYQTRLAKLL